METTHEIEKTAQTVNAYYILYILFSVMKLILLLFLFERLHSELLRRCYHNRRCYSCQYYNVLFKKQLLSQI